jgi:hypothetical protein
VAEINDAIRRQVADTAETIAAFDPLQPLLQPLSPEAQLRIKL